MNYYLAVDIGATSGRHMLGHLEDGKLVMEEIYRFSTHGAQKNESWVWQCDALLENVIKGMEVCKKLGKIPSVMGIDSFGAEFVLLDKSGGKLCDCAEFRDDALLLQTMSEVGELIPGDELYKRTGITGMPFDTIYQLKALKHQCAEVFAKAGTLLMIPAYLNYMLTGIIKEEYTTATTTGLIDVQNRNWDIELISKLGFPKELFAKLYMPGEIVGTLSDKIINRIGFDCTVVLPIAHDTASAYFAAPTMDENAAIISSGTWNLLGIRSNIPIATSEALQAGFSNEGAYPENYKILKIIIGFYMIEMINRELSNKYDYSQLTRMALEAEEIDSIIDMRNLMYLMVPSIIEAVKNECEDTNQRIPESESQILQVVFHSMAKSYAEVISDLQKVTGKKYSSLYIVGGGSQNEYLNSLAAKETGLTVYAGPSEAAVIGNFMCQMLANKEFHGLEEAINVELASFPIRKYE